MTKLVNGIGFNDRKQPSRVNGKAEKEYCLWLDMLRRCTEKVWASYPTYKECTVSENFKYYTYFYNWCQNQIGFGRTDKNGRSWQLDKDLLVPYNKFYSEDTCVFLPPRVNTLLTKSNSSRGELPIGVHWVEGRKKYRSICQDGKGKLKHLGLFVTVEDTFAAYKVFKEQIVKDVANEYREQLDIRAYQALMQYEVNIDD